MENKKVKHYNLEKLRVKEGCESNVPYCAKEEGYYCVYIERDENLEACVKINEPELDQIKEGGEVIVYANIFHFLKTSSILKILKKDEDSIEFETGSSVYKLIIKEEEE